MTSRAKSLRTNAYTLSPANCSLDGTTAALRDESTKNVDTTITERNTSNTGLVSHATESEIGGRLKSLVLGGTNPAPAACKLANARTHTPQEIMGYRPNAGEALKAGQPYVEKQLPVKSEGSGSSVGLVTSLWENYSRPNLSQTR